MALKKPEISTEYDDNTDVLQVTFGTGEPSYSREIDDCLVLEVGMFSQTPTGFQIIGFKEKGCKIKVEFGRIAKLSKKLLVSRETKGVKQFNRVFRSAQAQIKELLPNSSR